MENLIAIRDTAFYWVGVWTIMNAVTLCVKAAVQTRRVGDVEDNAPPVPVKREPPYDWAKEEDGTPGRETHDGEET